MERVIDALLKDATKDELLAFLSNPAFISASYIMKIQDKAVKSLTTDQIMALIAPPSENEVLSEHSDSDSETDEVASVDPVEEKLNYKKIKKTKKIGCE